MQLYLINKNLIIYNWFLLSSIFIHISELKIIISNNKLLDKDINIMYIFN